MENSISASNQDNLIFELKDRILELETAIEKHYNASTGHDQCWENDEELWAVLKDGKERKYDHSLVPSAEEFDRECKKYRESRLKNV